ncbi:hypothetical protein T09_1700 [Trichinella sp. T9]|nr:hypothetical protein T09_1700 [Trichinella sp. T9]
MNSIYETIRAAASLLALLILAFLIVKQPLSFDSVNLFQDVFFVRFLRLLASLELMIISFVTWLQRD